MKRTNDATRTVEEDLLDAIAKVEDDLWIKFDCCRKRRIVVDAVLPVLARHLPSLKPKPKRKGRKAGGK